jgi:phosphodiesterase/alkaline phosphatase D-like protein
MFLGDYIYEARSPASALRTDDIAAVDLATYRAKYALYRSDPNLRELHRLHPTAHVWDDHEVENDYSDNNPAPALAQRWAGYRASFEWLPRMSFPRDRHRVYKSFTYGAFAEIFMLDERQYRTGSNDGQERHILGQAQMQWLLAGLKASRATWKIVGNPVLLATVSAHPNPDGDAWDGYAADRALLLGTIESAGIDNVVFLTGDAHVFMCNLLASDLSALGNGSTRKPSAVEYLPGSVTSRGNDTPESQVQATAPWNIEYNGAAHGYARVSVAADQLVCDYMASDISNPAGGTALLEHFTQPLGSNHPQRESHATARA